MKLEEQIEKLSDIGLSLNKGVTINDLLLSYSREEYESNPFDLILFVYGIEIEEEPWGRFVCDQAWNFDVEAIEDDGSYTEIVKQFHRITGRAKSLEGLRDSVNLEEHYAELQYSVDGVNRLMKPEIDDDWADAKTIDIILSDLRQPGFDFYPKDNGQASIWFYLSESQAIELNKLANNVFNLERKP
ncbi:hypothetical protein D8T65_23745 [Vibrio vulnificus]|uniref:hypothetical protein n=2 Tax=Vibrionaceae TaxID=641 RepID=UPI001029EA43|nr:hypothetical protein [Vibrio vulnificus]EGR0209181.1 hypothetical protein [Vibrio vulnificus]MCU8501321.1 hypothetical protein [Vibrio vulnificus]RZP96042.1 hypothetical protein D8T65_23745 [Vibrio vulnificus]